MRRVHPALAFGAIAVLGFGVGSRVELWRQASTRELAANASPLPARAAKLPRLRGSLVVPVALTSQAAPDLAGAPLDAPLTATATAPLAAAPLAEVPAAAAAEADSDPAEPPDPPPSYVTGRDPDTNVEFYEMKDLPEVEGQAKDTGEPAHDVDMVEPGRDAGQPDEGTAKKDTASSPSPDQGAKAKGSD